MIQTARSGTAERADVRRLVVAGTSLAFFVLLVRTAWLDDDAYITFRTVDNVLNGFGLRWNVLNRVQAYTHPLWMFAMTAAAAITGEVYYASILLSLVVSLAAVALLTSRITGSVPAALLAVSVLLLSKAFVDYSTSGLENPLTHLLLIAFFISSASITRPERRVLLLSLCTAGLMLNRFDTGLLALPILVLAVWELGLGRAWRPLLVGLIPLAAWEAFSVIYYGFPFPNTAYSKLRHDIPQGDILYQGVLYLLDSIGNDPLTIAVIAAALLSAVIEGDWPIPAGIALYLTYIVWVGGDFMSGRFLTAPLLAAVVQLTRQGIPRLTTPVALAFAVVWTLGLATPRPTVTSSAAYGSDIEPALVIAPTGITDERRYYYPQSGLLNAHRGVSMPNHKWLYMGYEARAKGDRVLTTDAAGFIGYAAGPGVYFVDRYGLGDPLISRLPAETPWRIGHFVRRTPDGYLETVGTSHNRIRDPGVAQYYDKLRLITEGPIWTRERLLTIVAMNLGRYEHLIETYGRVQVSAEDVGAPKPDGTDWNLPENVIMTAQGAAVSMHAPTEARAVELSVSRNDQYDLTFLHEGRPVHKSRLDQRERGDSSLVTHVIDVPEGTRFDAILIEPSGGDARYSLGHLRILPR
jgi:arabinofuranosyltransferase